MQESEFRLKGPHVELCQLLKLAGIVFGGWQMGRAALIAADKQIIQRAHDHGIKVIGATLTPYQGTGYASPAGEQVRTGLNNWIKTSGAFDGVVDFAAATADAANPLAFRPDYNITDKLHPNDAGYEAMGKAIDLGLFK